MAPKTTDRFAERMRIQKRQCILYRHRFGNPVVLKRVTGSWRDLKQALYGGKG